MEELINSYKNWQYKNTALLIVSLAVFFYLSKTPYAQELIRSIGDIGYIGAFITGVFFVSLFTVAPASVVLFYLAKTLDPFGVALLGGAGAVIGDYIIFRFLKDRVFEELAPAFQKMGGTYITDLLKTPYFSWLLPIIGAVIIASPFPDELGISMIELSRVKNWHFILITFLLNSVGIFIIITFARAL